MTTRLVPTNNALKSGSGLAALLLAAWCSPTLAATGVDVECPESEPQNQLVATNIEIPQLDIPSLKISVADHGVDSSSDIEDEISDPPLASPAVTKGEEVEEAAEETEDADAGVSDTSPTATRLPGVSESEQPRFRRQMYRTDI